jgi:hypothetical protein
MRLATSVDSSGIPRTGFLRWGHRVDVLIGHRDRVVALERRMPGEHVIQHGRVHRGRPARPPAAVACSGAMYNGWPNA